MLNIGVEGDVVWNALVIVMPLLPLPVCWKEMWWQQWICSNAHTKQNTLFMVFSVTYPICKGPKLDV